MLPPLPSTSVPGPRSAVSSPLVTIAIPTYNRAGTYLPQALQSALRQTYPNLEIIVSDNCSTDYTQDFVTRIDNDRIKYFRHEHSIRPNDNFNFCFEQATGRYLLLLHDDDLIDGDFVESCLQAAQGNREVGVIRTGTRLIDSEGKVITELPNQASRLTTEEFFRAWFLSKTAIYLCSTLFNTQRLRETGGFKSRHNCYQDTMAVMRLAAQYGRVDVPAVRASFRLHSGEMALSRKISEWCEDSLELLHCMCELVPDSKAEILKEGTRFFARANYHRASTAKSPWKRAVATMKVMKYFNYRRLPSFNLILHILHGTHLYNIFRFIKRSALRPLRANAAG